MIELLEYHRVDGSNSYKDWFDRLDIQAAGRISIALTRLVQGNVSNVKGVGGGVYERRLDFGPGYRIYFGRDGERIVILLGAVRNNVNRGTSSRRS
jgi:putative addiction module killer protein